MTDKSNLELYAAANNPAPPEMLGIRYDAERFLPEAGNTIVCHLDMEAPEHQAVLEARARMMALPAAENFLFTPVKSLHMTLFEGIIETRRIEHFWPAGMDRNAPVEEVTPVVQKRLADFQPLPDFSVRAKGVEPTGLILTGATADDDAKMLAWREALTEPFGYRHTDHDDYFFHMTFAYPIGWIPDDLLPVWDKAYRSILEDLLTAAPVIPLRAPAFCTFADMTWFEEELVLAP